MGFAIQGNFLLSYTQNVEADEHTAFPIYVYRLHWWKFTPHKRLKKVKPIGDRGFLKCYYIFREQVSEVRLFGEEEIEQDVKISICQFPTDSSRIVIHGLW